MVSSDQAKREMSKTPPPQDNGSTPVATPQALGTSSEAEFNTDERWLSGQVLNTYTQADRLVEFETLIMFG